MYEYSYILYNHGSYTPHKINEDEDEDDGHDDSLIAREHSYCIATSTIIRPGAVVEPAIWLSAAAVSLLTTKYLLTNGFHFPMHLLFLQLAGVLTLRLIRSGCYWAISKDPSQGTPSHLRCERSSMILYVFYILSVSGALLCGYQAINHLHNLPLVTMILSLDWEPFGVGSGSSGDHAQWQARLEHISGQILVLAGIGLVLLFDFRLCGTGVVMLLLSAALTGLARLLFFRVQNTQLWASDNVEAKSEPVLVRLNLNTLGLLGALLSALFWCHFREQQFSRVMAYNPWTSHIPMFALNLCFTSVALELGGDVFRRNGLRPVIEDSELLHHRPYGGLIMSTALVGLVFVGSMLTILPPVISLWQWVGFAVASLAALSTQGDYSRFSKLVHHQTNSDIECKLIEETPRNHRARHLADETRRSSYIVLAIVAVLAFTALLLHSTTAHISAPLPSYDAPDRIFSSTHTLDIVVSRYDEPSSEVAKHINEILTLPNIQHLNPTVRIYNKGEDSNSSSTFRLQPNEILCLDQTRCPRMIVETVENIGRESHTYLRHITTQWEDLADHTIFMQADVHRGPWEYTQRIQDYFVPSTGFLSLARVGVHCSSCDHCYDKDWSEEPSLLHKIYGDFNNGTECQNLVLTYRGQFIVSAERIRRNNKATYQRWLDQLTNPRSEIHTAPYINGTRSVKEDSLSAPRAGFTFERTWGVMLQCNEKRIADRCPSLLSGVVCPPSICGVQALEDCQCLD